MVNTDFQQFNPLRNQWRPITSLVCQVHVLYPHCMVTNTRQFARRSRCPPHVCLFGDSSTCMCIHSFNIGTSHILVAHLQVMAPRAPKISPLNSHTRRLSGWLKTCR